jgi:hypothetical protein
MASNTGLIPPDLRRAFQDAVSAYSNWLGEPEPKVSFRRRTVPISTVAQWVMSFKDPMPDDIHRKLLTLIDAVMPAIADDLFEDGSYLTGGGALLQLINARKAKMRRGDPGESRP